MVAAGWSTVVAIRSQMKNTTIGSVLMWWDGQRSYSAVRSFGGRKRLAAIRCKSAVSANLLHGFERVYYAKSSNRLPWDMCSLRRGHLPR
jgi:hypothetical protein